MDYDVLGPGGKVIMDGEKERQGDFVFTAQEVGEYRFCFNNEMSTFAEKTVDFEIAVRTLGFLLTSRHWLLIRRVYRSRTSHTSIFLPSKGAIRP